MFPELELRRQDVNIKTQEHTSLFGNRKTSRLLGTALYCNFVFPLLYTLDFEEVREETDLGIRVKVLGKS